MGSGFEGADDEIFVSVLAMLELMGDQIEGASESPTRTNNALPETFAEWASHFSLKTHFERFLAILVYLFDRGKPAVTTNDVLTMYEKARWSKPANAADILAKGA